MVQVPDAVLGTRLEVPTLDGHATATVPPGTQPDTVLQLPHKGLPVFDSSERGDLYLRVCVYIPEQLSAEEHTLYERLRTLHEQKT
jgi:molecular chaperone DnaJ